MVRKDVACSIGWNDIENPASDFSYFNDIARVHGWDKFKRVNGCLVVHN
jgi:hypothetical protein